MNIPTIFEITPILRETNDNVNRGEVIKPNDRVVPFRLRPASRQHLLSFNSDRYLSFAWLSVATGILEVFAYCPGVW